MRFIAIFAALLLQAQTFPQPFDRDGANKVLENDRVIVWDVAWLPRAYPTHRHVYDYAGVYYTSGASGCCVSGRRWASANPHQRLGYFLLPERRHAQ